MGRRFLEIVLILISCGFIYSQSFTTKPYITIPGDNYDIDVLYNSMYFNVSSFICWVNHKDSLYTLYLKQVGQDSSKNIVIFSDTAEIAKPTIDFAYGSNSNVRIAWQSFINNHWQILLRECNNGFLGNVLSITDSLANNTNPGLSPSVIAWIQNSNLLYKYLDSRIVTTYLLDSLDCSNPKILKDLGYSGINIVYEKGNSGNKEIILKYYECCSRSDTINITTQLSNGGNNLNPRFGTEGSNISYEEYESSFSRSVYKLFWDWDTTFNALYNCSNPVALTFPIITKTPAYSTHFFVVYDSDSLLNNKEIILKPDFMLDTLINLSNATGDDYLPYISFFTFKDTEYIAVFWTHDQNGKKDIWMAFSKFYPIYGAISDLGVKPAAIALYQNYPNPFNPSTKIEWHQAKSAPVTLKVYDILGNEIATLINGYESAGDHSIILNAEQNFNKKILSSGVYLYQLKSGGYTLTKKMLYLK